MFILLHSDVTTQYENVTRVVNAAMIWFHIPPCRYHPALKSALAEKAGGEVSYEWKAVKTDDDRVYYYNKVTYRTIHSTTDLLTDCLTGSVFRRSRSSSMYETSNIVGLHRF